VPFLEFQRVAEHEMVVFSSWTTTREPSPTLSAGI
jgi:hypothetical protein